MFIPALFINAELSQTSQSGVAAEIGGIAWKYSPDTKQFRRCKIEGARVWASSSLPTAWMPIPAPPTLQQPL